MKEVIILILLLTLFQTFVLLYYCQNKNNNYKDTENYTPPLKIDCYSKDINGNLVVDKNGIYNKSGGYEMDCYCNRTDILPVGCYDR